MKPLWLLLLLLWGCAPALPEPDPGLRELTMTALRPALLLPGSDVVVEGKGLPGAAEGTVSLRLAGLFTASSGTRRGVDLRLRAQVDGPTRARVTVGDEFYAGLSGQRDGVLTVDAQLIVESAIDLQIYTTPPVAAVISLRSVLAPRLDAVDLYGAQKGTGRLHPNDWVQVRGSGLLLGGREGRTVAVLNGCFLPDKVLGECALVGVAVKDAVVPLRSTGELDRQSAVFAYAPTLHGVRTGRFTGTVTLQSEQPGQPPLRSTPQPLVVAQILPEVRSFSPAAASLGQYVEIAGAGFIGGQPGQATLVRLLGTYVPEGQPRMAPVDLLIVAEYVPRYPSGPAARYVLDESDALGKALLVDGGLRKAAGTFTGTATPVLRYGKEEVTGLGARVELRLLHVKQVVQVNFLASYLDTLRLLGLRTADNAVRARVLEVARRDYAGVNIEFRVGGVIEDHALYSVVDIGGADPNGLGFLGYDNTPGRDVGNTRLFDRIGGVNAVTQEDGSPGFGGIFAEQFLGFSARPLGVEKIPTLEEHSVLFDRVFDPVRPGVGGTPARLDEVERLPALSDGSLCPAPPDDRTRQVACAVFVLGTLIGNTMTHEVGHSLGLANPNTPNGSYHSNGRIAGRLMNAGALRPFPERAELGGGQAALFCESEYAYLRTILPGTSGDPQAGARPSCME